MNRNKRVRSEKIGRSHSRQILPEGMVVGWKLKKSDRSSAVGHARFVWVCSVVSFVFVSVHRRTIDISSLLWNIIIYYNHHGVAYGHRKYCTVIRKWQSVRPVRRQGRTVTYLPTRCLRSLPYVYDCNLTWRTYRNLCCHEDCNLFVSVCVLSPSDWLVPAAKVILIIIWF